MQVLAETQKQSEEFMVKKEKAAGVTDWRLLAWRSWRWADWKETSYVICSIQFSSVQFLSCIWLYATPGIAARQALLSITNSQSPPKPMYIDSVMPSSHLILCCPLLLLPLIFPIIRVLSNESALHIRWSKYWSFSFNISPSNEHPGLISFRMDWLDLLAVQGTLKSINSSVLSFLHSLTLTSIHDHWKNHSLDNMPANLENSAVVTGLEKVSFHSNPKERQCQRMFRNRTTALISHASKVMLKILQGQASAIH